VAGVAEAADISQNITLEEVNKIPKVTVDKLKSRIDKGKRVMIVDVRTGDSWSSSKVKIKGAVRIPFKRIANSAGDIPMGSEIITYCT